MAQDTLARVLAMANSGGGSSDYNDLENKPVAGDGINISSTTVPVISVDSTVVQGKLSAGSGIDITGATISCTVESPIDVEYEVIHHPAEQLSTQVIRNGDAGNDYDVYGPDAALIYNNCVTGTTYSVNLSFVMDEGYSAPTYDSAYIYFTNKGEDTIGTGELSLHITSGGNEHRWEFYTNTSLNRVHIYQPSSFDSSYHAEKITVTFAQEIPAWDENLTTVTGTEGIIDKGLNIEPNGQISTSTNVTWPVSSFFDSWFKLSFSDSIPVEDYDNDYGKFDITDSMSQDKLWEIINTVKNIPGSIHPDQTCVVYIYDINELKNSNWIGSAIPPVVNTFEGVTQVDWCNINNGFHFHGELDHINKEASAYIEIKGSIVTSGCKLSEIYLNHSSSYYTSVPSQALKFSNDKPSNIKGSNSIYANNDGLYVYSANGILELIKTNPGLNIDYGGTWDETTSKYTDCVISPEVPLYSEKEFIRDTTYDWSETYTGFPVKSEASYYDNRSLTSQELTTLMSHLPRTCSTDPAANRDINVWKTLVHFVATFTDGAVLEFDAVPNCQYNVDAAKIFSIFRPEYNYQGISTGIEFCVWDDGETQRLQFESNYAYDHDVSLASLVIAIPKLDTFTADLTNISYDGGNHFMINDAAQVSLLKNWLEQPIYYDINSSKWPANYYIVEATYGNGNKEALVRYNSIEEGAGRFMNLTYGQSPWIDIFDSNNERIDQDPWFSLQADNSRLDLMFDPGYVGSTTLTSLTLKRVKGTFQYNYHQLPAEYVPVDDTSIKVEDGVLTIPALPTPPSADGEYDLHCSISSGTVTYSWVART